MKTNIHGLVAFAMVISFPVIAQAAPPDKVSKGSGSPTETQQTMAALAKGAVVPKFKVILKSGNEKTLKNATVKKVEPDGIIFMHEDGLTKVPFDNLPPEFRKKYGYDPQKAKSFADEEEKRQTELDKIVERQKEYRQNVAQDIQDISNFLIESRKSQAAADNARRSQPNEGTVTDPKPEDFSDPTQARRLMARYARNSPEIASSQRLADQATGNQGAVQQSDANMPKSFADGYREGYAKANRFGICPIPPLPPFGHNTFTDGVGYGYLKGMNDAKGY